MVTAERVVVIDAWEGLSAMFGENAIVDPASEAVRAAFIMASECGCKKQEDWREGRNLVITRNLTKLGLSRA